MRTILMDLPALLNRFWRAGEGEDGRFLEDGSWLNTSRHALAQFVEYRAVSLLRSSAPIHWIGVLDSQERYRQRLCEDLSQAAYRVYKRARKEKRAAEPKEIQDTRAEIWKQAAEILPRLGMSVLTIEDLEADDTIAYLAQHLPGRIDILTTDSDLIQLASNRIRVFLGEQPAVDYQGIAPRFVPLYKALVGDKTDGYPGAPGFGPKKFAKLQTALGEEGLIKLEKILDQPERRTLLKRWLEKDPQPLLELLLPHADDLFIQLELARLHPEWATDTPARKHLWQRGLPIDIQHTLTELGIPEHAAAFRAFEVKRHLVTGDNLAVLLPRLTAQIESAPLVAFDYESYDPWPVEAFQEASKNDDFVDVLGQHITGVSFAVGPNLNEIYYLAVNHQDTPPVALETVKEVIKTVEAKRPLAAHNAFFEAVLTRTHLNYRLRDLWDTKLLAHHLDENHEVDLKSLSKRYLGYQQLTYKETLEAANAMDMRGLTGEQVLQYGADDSLCTAHLFMHLRRLTQLEGTWEFIRDYEFAAVHPLVDAYLEGVSVDVERLKTLQAEDKKAFEQAMNTVRQSLEVEAREEDARAAETLFHPLGNFEQARLKASGKSEEEIKKRLDALWERCLSGTRYVPPYEAKKKVEFKFTPGKLNAVRKILGLEPEIESVSFAALNRWMGKLPKVKDNQRPTLVKLLVDLLSDRVEFKRQNGKKFQALVDYCQTVLEEDAPTEMHGDELNLDSTVQMQTLLYGKLKLPIRLQGQVLPGSTRAKLGFEGAPAVDVKALELAAAEDAPEGDWRRPVLLALMEAKACSTREKFFYHPLPLWVSPRDQKVHPQFKSIGTVTRRPSGSHPNFLQLPKRDGGRVRAAIVADPGCVVVSIDFSQEEIRLMGSESRDPVIIDAFTGTIKKDIHTITACAIAPGFIARSEDFKETDFNLSRDGIDYHFFREALESKDKRLALFLKNIRRVAKITNFLLVYGGGPMSLSRQLLMPQTITEEFIDGFFKAYPKVRAWQEATVIFAKAHGYTQTVYGSRRHCWPMIVDPNRERKSRMERQAVNFTIQGTAADILKIVLSEAHRQNLFQDTGARLVAPVYDELCSIVPLETLIPYVRRMTAIMELTPPGHAIPMEAEVSVGQKNWGEQIELGAHPSDEALLEAAGQLPARRLRLVMGG